MEGMINWAQSMPLKRQNRRKDMSMEFSYMGSLVILISIVLEASTGGDAG